MNDVCSIELLRNAVASRLSTDEEEALHTHLTHCEACCAQMEQMAGGEAWQRETAALLAVDELDATVPRPAVWSEVDFSVEHLDPSNDANVLGQLGGYDVLAIVGRGGMGVVLKAFDRELKRFVAIKTLAPHLAHSSVARKRFAREAQAAAAVVNPHVISIHHVQPSGRLPFLIMPLLTGESLAQRLKSRAPLELAEVLRIGIQAAAGLAAAHDQGLVHRDVKPANIFLEKGVERVVITDFGLARAADDVSMTRQGVVAGTPEYMSPEQARGEALDGRSDLFSLGCVLYEMATGRSPFRADSTMATLRRIVEEKPAAMASLAPEMPLWFNQIVERLLSKDPAQRFASANEVSQLLEQCLSHLQQPTSVAPPAFLVPHAAGRRSTFYSHRTGIIAMLGTLAVALLGMMLWQTSAPPEIAGPWTSEEWGTVVLEAKQPGQYEGVYDGSNKRSSGRVHLRWSRLERRFNGTWGTVDARSGLISLRLVDNEIRGAWTANKAAQKEPGSPRLADLLWTRSATAHQSAGANEQRTLDLKNARSVVEAYVAAALVGNVATAASLAKGSPAEREQIDALAGNLNLKRLAMKSVYVNDPEKPTRALATSEAVKLQERQPDGQQDGFLVLTLTISQERWFVTDIDFESEEGADGELRRFHEANPNSIGLPPRASNDSQVSVRITPDADGIYWSKRADNDWVPGMKVTTWPTALHPKMVVQFVLRNDTSETRDIGVRVKKGNRSSLAIGAGNTAIVDFKESHQHKRTAEPGEVLEFTQDPPEISFAGLDSGDYTLRFGEMGGEFVVQDKQNPSVGLGMPFHLSLPVTFFASVKEMPIRWGEPLAGLRLGAMFAGVKSGVVPRFRPDDQATIHLFIQNVTQKKMTCCFQPHDFMGKWRFSIKGHAGERKPAFPDPNLGRGGIRLPPPCYVAELAPGEVLPITGQLPTFRDGREDPPEDMPILDYGCFNILAEKPEEARHGTPLDYVLPAGRYFAAISVDLIKSDTPDAKYRVECSGLEFEVTDLRGATRGRTLDRRNARWVVEAYVAAALVGNVAKATSFAKGNPAERKQIESLADNLNLNRLAMRSVYVNDPEKGTTALATSDAVRLEERQPDGQRDGFLVLTLTFSQEGWLVTDIDFESKEGAEGELKQFLDANPNAMGMPPLTAKVAY